MQRYELKRNLQYQIPGKNLPDRPQGFEGELFRLLFESAEIATFTPLEKTELENGIRQK